MATLANTYRLISLIAAGSVRAGSFFEQTATHLQWRPGEKHD